MMKNIKKLIALLLVATISYPTLAVNGDNLQKSNKPNSGYEENINQHQEGDLIIEEEGSSSEDDNTTEEGVDSDKDNSEQEDVEDSEGSGAEVNPENPDSESEDEVNPEEPDSENEADGENEVTQPEQEEEPSNEEGVESVTPEIEEEDSVEDNSKGIKKGTIYSSTTLKEKMPSSFSIYGDEDYVSPEVLEKREAMLNFKVLIPMTDANYEIALAHEDGSYSFIATADTMEAAVSEVEKLRLEYDNISEIPAVVSNDGQVVYSTNSMGRVIQYRNGEVAVPVKDVTNVYVNSNLTNAYTYVNADYIDDVPIISETSTTAKVRLNGYDGWINKNVDSKNYEMIVVPMNQVVNPSHYYVSGGALYHYIAKDMTIVGSGSKYGSSIRIGVAPPYFKEGVKYFSYDGKYFYTGSSIGEGLNKLVADLRNGTVSNAVNGTNPFYNYYTYLPFRTRTNYSAGDLDKFINANTQSNSKLRGLGSVFIECQEKYGVNPLLALGVAINESAWGTSKIALEKNNLFGMNAVDSSPGESANYFKTPGDSVREFTRYYISRGYADPEDYRYHGGYLGNKALGANVKYASDPYWGEKAAQHAFTVDYEISGKNIRNLKDYNGYKLAVFNGATEVRNSAGTLLYSISGTEGPKGSKGNVVALKFQDSASGKYQIFAERTTDVSTGEYHGDYNFNDNGYVNTSALTFINSPTHHFIPGYAKEDVNKNGVINKEDMDLVSKNYHTFSGASGFKYQMDLNSDGIIDLYDLVYISKKVA